MTELTPGLEDNRYEQAFPDEIEKLEDDLLYTIAMFERGKISRPALAARLMDRIETFHQYAKNTEQVM